jgi:hypothetical protein
MKRARAIAFGPEKPNPEPIFIDLTLETDDDVDDSVIMDCSPVADTDETDYMSQLIPDLIREEVSRHLSHVDLVMFSRVSKFYYDNIFGEWADYLRFGYPDYTGIAESGTATLLQFAFDSYGLYPSTRQARQRASIGHTETVKWLLALEIRSACDPKKKPVEWDGAICQGLCMGGHLELLQWVYKEKRDHLRPFECLRYALDNGHLDVATWIYDNVGKTGGYYKDMERWYMDHEYTRCPRAGHHTVAWFQEMLPTWTYPLSRGMFGRVTSHGVKEWLVARF